MNKYSAVILGGIIGGIIGNFIADFVIESLDVLYGNDLIEEEITYNVDNEDWDSRYNEIQKGVLNNTADVPVQEYNNLVNNLDYSSITRKKIQKIPADDAEDSVSHEAIIPDHIQMMTATEFYELPEDYERVTLSYDFSGKDFIAITSNKESEYKLNSIDKYLHPKVFSVNALNKMLFCVNHEEKTGFLVKAAKPPVKKKPKVVSTEKEEEDEYEDSQEDLASYLR